MWVGEGGIELPLSEMWFTDSLLYTGPVHSSLSLPSPPPQGLSSLGLPYLTDTQFTALCDHYVNPSRKECVCWKKFLNDVDQGGYGPGWVWTRVGMDQGGCGPGRLTCT